METPLDKEVLAANLILLSAMQEAFDRLEERGVPAMVLKGGVFAPFLYSRVDMRPMEDIDLLVGRGRLGEARDVLATLGYERVPGNPSELALGGITLDLEEGLWYLDPAEEEAFWKRSLVFSDAQTRVRAPSWEDHLIVLLAHNAVHHLCWDVTHAEDLRLLLARPLDFAAAADRLSRWRLAPAAAATFAVLGLDRASPNPHEARHSGASAPLGRAPLNPHEARHSGASAPLDAPRPLPRRADLNWPGRLEAAFLGRVMERSPLSPVGHLMRLWTSPRRGAALYSWLFPGPEFLRARYADGNTRTLGLLRPLFLAAKAVGAAGAGGVNDDPGWRNGETRRARALERTRPPANRPG